MREKAPFEVASATFLAIVSVPLLKLVISNTPIGPFHRIVLDSSMTRENASIAFGPISKPIQPSTMLSELVVLIFALLEKLSATTLSTGR